MESHIHNFSIGINLGLNTIAFGYTVITVTRKQLVCIEFLKVLYYFSVDLYYHLYSEALLVEFFNFNILLKITEIVVVIHTLFILFKKDVTDPEIINTTDTLGLFILTLMFA